MHGCHAVVHHGVGEGPWSSLGDGCLLAGLAFEVVDGIDGPLVD